MSPWLRAGSSVVYGDYTDLEKRGVRRPTGWARMASAVRGVPVTDGLEPAIILPDRRVVALGRFSVAKVQCREGVEGLKAKVAK